MIQKPQYGALTGANIDAIGGRLLMLEAHAKAQEEALTRADAAIAERDARVARLEADLKAERKARSVAEKALAAAPKVE